MSDWKLPWEGGCRCGETRVRVTKAPYLANACHCRGCQTMSASAFSLTLTLPADGLEVIAGAPVLAGAQPQRMHYACPTCKTWMFTRPPEVSWIVNLRPTVLDEHGWYVPFVEFFTDEKLPWATTPAVHSFAKFPDLTAFEPLMQAFAVEGARP